MRATAFGFLLLLLPVLGGMSMQAEAQETIAADLDGATVQLVIPAGYCLFDRSNPTDKAVWDFYQGQRMKTSRILAFFLECTAHVRLREEGIGDVILLPDYGTYIVEVDDDAVTVYSGLTRAEYAREFAAAFQEIDSDEISAGLKERLSDLDAAEDSSAEFQHVGVTGFDNEAAYLLVVADTKLRGQSQLITGAGAMTLVEERALSIMLSRFVDEPADIDAVQQDAKSLLRDLLAANPD